MDEKSHATLELPKVLDRLASLAAFSASKELARGLIPTSDLALAQRRHTETTEARKILAAHPEMSIGGVRPPPPEGGLHPGGGLLGRLHLFVFVTTPPTR